MRTSSYRIHPYSSCSVTSVARAGLSILSLDETREESFPANTRSEAASQVEETARLGLKWPPVDPQEEEDEEVSSSKGGWHDTAPKNFKLEVSSLPVSSFR